MRRAAGLRWPAAPQQKRRAGGDEWLYFDVDGDGHAEYAQRMRAGFKDRIEFHAPGHATPDIIDRPTTPDPQRPLLLMLLDGVAFERIRRLYDAGRFRLFRRPAKLVSVFPTLTDPAYDTFFQTGPTPGYEAGYFDRRRNRMADGFTGHLFGRNEAWVRLLDYRISYIKDALMYLFPRWTFPAELKRARHVLDRCRAGGRRHIVLYILSTDGLGHMLPPAGIERQLTLLDDWLERIVFDYRGGLDIFMMADHGLGWLPPDCTHVRCFDIRRVLANAGLRLVKRLRGPGEIAMPMFGLLDVARVHAYDEEARDQAVAALRRCPEIELIAVRENQHVHVYAGGQVARIDRLAGPDGREFFKYQPLEGDPLRLGDTLERLRSHPQANGDGFATPRAWLQCSADDAFPAAPQRLWEGLFSISREQPDAVLSLSDRCFIGSGLLSRFVRMQGTHGGLHQRATATFAMATCLDLPSPLDLREAGTLVREEFGWDPAARR